MNVPLFVATGILVTNRSSSEGENETIDDLYIDDELSISNTGINIFACIIGIVTGIWGPLYYNVSSKIEENFDFDVYSVWPEMAELMTIIILVIFLAIIFYQISSKLTRRSSLQIKEDINRIKKELIDLVNESRNDELDRYPNMKERLQSKINKQAETKIQELETEARELIKKYC